MNRENLIRKATLIALVCNLLIAALKMFAGNAEHSAGLFADGVHSLADLAGDVVVLVFLALSTKTGKAFAHSKYENAATLLVALILVVVGADLLSDGVRSIVDILGGGAVEVPGSGAFLAGVIAMVGKELLYRYTSRMGRKAESPVVVANAWHYRTDALSTLASIVAIALARLLGSGWAVLDPLAGCGISVLIIVIAVKTALPVLEKKK